MKKTYVDLAFLNAVVSADESFWTANIRINGETMKFKVDSGVEVTAVTKDLGHDPKKCACCLSNYKGASIQYTCPPTFRVCLCSMVTMASLPRRSY